jgi:DNA mismatch endonuclease (patch repair protein)
MDRVTRGARSENMRRIRSRDTTPEMIVRRLVHGMGFRYRLHVHNLPGRPDLVFARSRKIIQVHGCFWHQHEGCADGRIPKSKVRYWKAKLTGNKRRDAENDLRLREQGWEVLTLWACELAPSGEVARRVRRFLGGGRRSTASQGH